MKYLYDSPLNLYGQPLIPDDELAVSEEDIGSDDPVKMFLRDIGKIPLLTEEEEKALAERVRQGDEEAKNSSAKLILDLWYQ